MANEITEFGQIATYGGPPLTLLGSPLAAQVNSLLIRQGSGTARAWKVFDPAKADFLNTYKVLNPSDTVLVNAKVLPMNFPAPTGTTSAPISWPAFSEAGSGPATEFSGLVDVSQSYLPVFAFVSGTGTLQMQLNGSGTWQAAGLVTVGNSVQFRILNTAAFAGVLTLTPA